MKQLRIKTEEEKSFIESTCQCGKIIKVSNSLPQGSTYTCLCNRVYEVFE